MKPIRELAAERACSDATRAAVQAYTALNTIITAMERMKAGAGDDFDRALLEQFTSDDYDREFVRLRINCPLGQRAMALGMLRTGKSTRAGVMR